MAAKSQKRTESDDPFVTVTIRVFDNRTEVEFDDFSKLSLGMLEKRVINATRKQWQHERRMAVYEARKADRVVVERERKTENAKRKREEREREAAEGA